MAKEMPGLMDKIVRDSPVVRADVDAFLHQPPPRTIPATIRERSGIGSAQVRTIQASCKIRGNSSVRAKKLMAEQKPASILCDPADSQYNLYTNAFLHDRSEYDL